MWTNTPLLGVIGGGAAKADAADLTGREGCCESGFTAYCYCDTVSVPIASEAQNSTVSGPIGTLRDPRRRASRRSRMFERPFFEVEDPDMTIELSDPGDSMDTDSQQQEGGE